MRASGSHRNICSACAILSSRPNEETGGTGLGLAICLSLARAHNGCLEFDSEPGKGTRVLVKFQCLDEPVPLYAAATA